MLGRFQKSLSLFVDWFLVFMPRLLRVAVLGFGACALVACEGEGGAVTQPVEHGFVGSVAADEPHAAQVAYDVMARGGNAADAATALGLALAVTLPSRASLGSGGACLAWKPGDSVGRAFEFLPRVGSDTEGKADRPAAVPMLARGLFVLQLRYGSVQLADLFTPAQNLASQGVPVSRLLASDLAVVQSALLADNNARSIFARSDGSVLKENDILVQTRLSGSLERLRTAGVGDLYGGALGQTFVADADAAGGALTIQDLRRSLVRVEKPLVARQNGVDLSFLPPPADGGLGMAARYLSNGKMVYANQVVAGWRHLNKGQGVRLSAVQHMLDTRRFPQGTSLAPLPASTSYVVTDRFGETVACVLSMNNLFGTGRVAGSTGIVLAASPSRAPKPLLPAGIAHIGKQEFRAVAAASGQNMAADAAAIALRAAVAGERPKFLKGSGRANSVSCPEGLPGDAARCFAWTDPRGKGLALPMIRRH